MASVNARLEVVEFEPVHVTLRGCSATVRVIQPDDDRRCTKAVPAFGPAVRLVTLDIAHGHDGG